MFGNKKLIVSIMVLPLIASLGVMFYLKALHGKLENSFYEKSAFEMAEKFQSAKQSDLVSAQLLAVSLANNPYILQALSQNSLKGIEEHLDYISKDVNEKSGIGKIWIHVVTADLVSLYRSWDKKRGDSLTFREDLKTIARDLLPAQGISVGKYSITYKNTIPVFEKGKLIGFVEAITFPNDTMERIKDHFKIDSVMLIHGEKTKQLTSNIHDKQVGGETVVFSSSDTLLEKAKELMEACDKGVAYVKHDGHLVKKVDITNLNGKVIGHILLSMDQNIYGEDLDNTLRLVDILTYISIVFFIALFAFTMFYYFTISKEMTLVKLLNEDMQRIIDENRAKILEQEYTIYEQNKQKALSELLVNIAHHWRQPLNVISMSLSMIDDALRYDNGDMKKVTKAMETAYNELDQLSASISSITSVFEKEGDKKVTLKEAIEVAKNTISDTLKVHNIEIYGEHLEDIHLSATKFQMHEILTTLFMNVKDVAVQRKLSGAQVVITQRVQNDKVIIEVKDNAGGIDKSMLPNKIFEPYTTTSFRSRNKGLNLYLAHRIVKEHLGGDMWAKNTQDGVVFGIELPMQKVLIEDV